MSEQLMEQAQRWHAALQRADADWDGFTVWLEADSANRVAYDQVALVDDLLDRHRGSLARTEIAKNVEQVSRPRWRLLAVAAVGVLALVLSWNRLFMQPAATTFTAAAGTTRQVELRDGSRIALAATSSLTVSGDQHRISLRGSAYFDVPHDPARSLVIDSGDFQVRDIGTRFEVATAPGGIRVAVAAGEVVVMRRNSPQLLPVTAGQQLVVSGTPVAAEYVAVATEDVASWRGGRLVFHNAPLSQVVAEISRHAGVEVAVDPRDADRRFSGVLTIGDGTALVGSLEDIMGLKAQQQDGGIRLASDRDQ